MKFLAVIPPLIFLLLVPLLVVESSSSPDNNLVGNITRGSSLFANATTPYWLSPSGNIAFGFYQLPCTHSSSKCPDRYVVGIWLVKSLHKTLVWTANRNDTPLYEPSSILFSNQGKLMLRTMTDNKQKPLLSDIEEPVSYAMMHDNGNFVLYGSDGQTVWESFDNPTDTILGGQKIKDGVELASSVSLFNRGSGRYRLSVRQSDGLVAIYQLSAHRRVTKVHTDTTIWCGTDGSINSPVTLNLDTTGELYIVGSDDVVLKYLHRNKNQQHHENDEGGYIYRATLDSNGDFVLYKERIDGDGNKKSSSDLVRLWSSDNTLHYLLFLAILFFGSIILVVIGIFISRVCC